MDLATPSKGVFGKIKWKFSAKTAKESDGVTKNLLPMIIFLSASPSQAQPNYGILKSMQFFILKGSMMSTNYLAYIRFGSGCPFPKSSEEVQFKSAVSWQFKRSLNILYAYGPATPCIPSMQNEKSFLSKSYFKSLKSNNDYNEIKNTYNFHI